MDVQPHQIAALCSHAAGTTHEVCGVLLGRFGPRLVLVTTVAARNLHPDPAQHFLLDAATLLQADAEARASGLEIIGFYHSHPNGLTLPSLSDRRDAWPGYVMLIVGARPGQGCSVSAWIVAADTTLRPETIRPRPGQGARPAQIDV